jgi:sodium pump decarboxylase gamma subunit
MDNLGWGLQMTVLGMGIVFGLLALLWALLTIVLRLDQSPQAPEPADAAADDIPALAPAADAAGGTKAWAMPKVQGMDADLVAAILVAVLTHEGVRRHEAAPAMRSYWPGSLLYASRWVATGRSRQTHVWHRRSK